MATVTKAAASFTEPGYLSNTRNFAQLTTPVPPDPSTVTKMSAALTSPVGAIATVSKNYVSLTTPQGAKKFMVYKGQFLPITEQVIDGSIPPAQF